MTHTHHLLGLISAYGYAFIFLGTFFEGELVVAAAGFLSYTGTLNFWIAMLVCFLGAVIGDNFWYLIGKYQGMKFMRRYGKYIGFKEHHFDKAQLFFGLHGKKAVFFSRFVYGTRLSTGIIAGATGMPQDKFLRANVSGALIWVGLIGSLGYLFGKSFKLLAVLVKRTEIVLLILALLAIIILIFRLKSRDKKSN